LTRNPSDAPRGRQELAPVPDTGAGWFVAPPEAEGVPRYLELLRARLWLIGVITAACIVGAVLGLSVAEKVYEAHTDLLVAPIPRENETLVGLGLPRETSDPTRDVETVSRLIETASVARRVQSRLNLKRSAGQLLDDIEVVPVAQSNIVTITAKANDPLAAARLADAFAEAAIADRTQKMHDQLATIIPPLRSQINQIPRTERLGVETLVNRLRDLEALRAMDDPTLRLEARAEPPTDPVSPRPVLSLAAAILGGLILGSGAALGLQLLDSRLRREEQLRRYRLPILARIPAERKSVRRERVPLTPDELSVATLDAYRLLAGALVAEGRDENDSRSVVVTGPTPGDGKSTTSINLAAALGAMNKQVILVDGDTRRPTIARALEIDSRHGLTSVIAGRVPLKDALVPVDRVGSKFEALLQHEGESAILGSTSPVLADRLVSQAERLADWLVFDAPALSHVPDALPFVSRADHVVLVVRLGHTRLRELEEIGELLSQRGVTPDGFVVVGGKEKTGYYYRHEESRN
jgi:Mrp family chromosome partitioning ATPase/capsular polysaccharide biosynthesis protein